MAGNLFDLLFSGDRDRRSSSRSHHDERHRRHHGEHGSSHHSRHRHSHHGSGSHHHRDEEGRSSSRHGSHSHSHSHSHASAHEQGHRRERSRPPMNPSSGSVRVRTVRYASPDGYSEDGHGGRRTYYRVRSRTEEYVEPGPSRRPSPRRSPRSGSRRGRSPDHRAQQAQHASSPQAAGTNSHDYGYGYGYGYTQSQGQDQSQNRGQYSTYNPQDGRYYDAYGRPVVLPETGYAETVYTTDTEDGAHGKGGEAK